MTVEEARARMEEWDKTLPRNPDWTPDHHNVWDAGCAVCDRKFKVFEDWCPVGEGDDLVHPSCLAEYAEREAEEDDDA